MISNRRLVKLVLIGLLMALTIVGLTRWKIKQGSLTPPSPGESVAASISHSSKQPQGFVVWSSNRHGNHDILKMALPDHSISRLTNHPHTEYYPRISPNGKQLVFSRSQKPWVSQRNQVPWDVILLDLNSGKQKLLAKNANTPTWSADGKKIYYQRNNVEFVEHHLQSGQQKVIYKSGKGDIKNNTILQTPHLSPDGKRISVTLRGKQNKTAIIDLNGNFLGTAGGCQLSWNQTGDLLYYTDHGGKMKNAFYIYDPKTGKSRMWLDLPGEYSHEYFPKLSNTQDFLIFAASSGGHEHDSADYEIFIWQIDQAVETAERLTFHTGNDNWPDLYLYTE